MSNMFNIPGMGNRLEQLRKEKKISQNQAAEAMGMSKSGYLKIARGERKLSVDHVLRAAKVYGVSPADIIDDNGSADSQWSKRIREAVVGAAQTGASALEIYQVVADAEPSGELRNILHFFSLGQTERQIATKIAQKDGAPLDTISSDRN